MQEIQEARCRSPTRVCSLVLPSPLQPFFPCTTIQPEFLPKKSPVNSSYKGKEPRKSPPACREQTQQHVVRQNHAVSGEQNASPSPLRLSRDGKATLEAGSTFLYLTSYAVIQQLIICHYSQLYTYLPHWLCTPWPIALFLCRNSTLGLNTKYLRLISALVRWLNPLSISPLILSCLFRLKSPRIALPMAPDPAAENRLGWRKCSYLS